MQPERTIRDVCYPQILAAGEQILDADRNQRAERDLERPAPKIEIPGTADARMEIDPVRANARSVGEEFRAIRPQRVRDMLLDDRELSPDSTRFSNVRSLSESVWRPSNDVAA